MKSPLLSLPGAVPGEGVDEGVAAHYGDLFREQRALADGAGFVDLSHRGVVTVTGEDRLAWLHLLLTQHVSELPAGEATEALILSAHGHIEHALYLVDDGTTVWAHVEPGTQEALIAYLESMKFFYRVEVADRAADFAVVHLPAYEALRVEHHRPRLGFETDHRTIPHELGWIGTAVHLQKGCYRGQETVARVQNLGKPPRRLVFLHLDGSEVHLPPHGTEIRVADEGEDGRRIGVVTTSVRHFELGPVALALVKRNVPADARLVAGETAAAQEVIVEP
jgi:tRNA-modifying protein YgfZ